MLKPHKKANKSNPIDVSSVPPHLKHLIMENVPEENCPWSLSGPQFPVPTAIQQRYCYPKGDPEYSSRKGGALWTMFNRDGQEDKTFRLLHVYHSSKRALNREKEKIPRGTKRGTTTSDESYSPQGKRPKRGARTPRRAPRGPRSKLSVAKGSTINPYMTSPAITVSSTESYSNCTSPGSIDTVPRAHRLNGSRPSSSLNAPMPALGSQAFVPFGEKDVEGFPTLGGIFSVSSEEMSRGHYGYPAFSRQDSHFHQHQYGRPVHMAYPVTHHGGSSGGPPNKFYHPGMSIMDTEEILLNEPMEEMSLHSGGSFDHLEFPNEPSVTATTTASFCTHLDGLHDHVREMIHGAPPEEQSTLMSTFASWAQNIAKQPLQRLQAFKQEEITNPNVPQNNIASVFRPKANDGASAKPNSNRKALNTANELVTEGGELSSAASSTSMTPIKEEQD